MSFPLNRSAANDVLSALVGRGVTSSQLAAALDISTDDAAALLSSGKGSFTVAEMKRIESLVGVPFVTLAMEGLYRRPSQTAAQIALLDTTAEIFPEIDATIAVGRSARLTSSANRSARPARRQRAS